MVAHTPKPWVVFDEGLGPIEVGNAELGLTICFMPGTSDEEDKANAHLIAEAPELRDSVLKFIGLLGIDKTVLLARYGQLGLGAVEFALDALAKAEGRR